MVLNNRKREKYRCKYDEDSALERQSFDTGVDKDDEINSSKSFTSSLKKPQSKNLKKKNK